MQYSEDELFLKLEKADAANDSAAAKVIADEIRRVQSVSNVPVETSPIDLGRQKVTSFGTKGTSVTREIDPAKGIEGYPELQSGVGIPNVQFKSPSDEQMAAAQRGVDTTTGSPEGRIQASLMPDSQKATFIREEIQKKLGADVDVRMNDIGKIEFVNPKTNRWTTFDEYGVSSSDLKDMAGDSITMALDVVGSIVGYGTGGAVGEAIGSGAGTFAGEQIKLNLGKALGYHDATQEQITGQAGTKAAQATAATVAGRGLMAGGQRLVYGKNPFSDDVTEEILNASKEADNVIAEINGRISGKNVVEPTMGERSGMPSVLDVEATAKSGTQNIQNEIIYRSQKRESEKGLVEFFDEATGGQRPDKVNVGSEVKGKFAEQTDARMARQDKFANKKRVEARAEAGALPTLDTGKIAKETRASFQSKLDEISDIEERAWGGYKKSAGYDEALDTSSVKIPRNEGIDTLVAKMSKEKGNAIFKQEGKNKNIILDSKLKPAKSDQITLLDKDGNDLITFSKDSGDYDLVHVQRALSHLKERIRISSKGLSSEEPNVGDLKRIVKELQTARNEHLLKNNPELLREIENAEAITKYKHDTFDKGLIGKVLKTDGGDYALDDEGVFLKIFSANNKQAAKEYASVLVDDPRAMQGARNTILALYKKTVVKDGIPDRKLHEKFVENYSGTINEFFNRNELRSITKLGGLSSVVAKHAEKLAKFEKAFNKSFKGKVKSFSPTEMVDGFFKNPTKENSMTGFDVKDVSRLKNYLNMYGETELKGYRATVSNEIKTKISKDGVFYPDRLRKLLEKTGDISDNQTGKMASLFGAQYARDMRTLLKAVEMVEKKGVPLAKTGEPAFWSVIKMYLGPLHRTSRFSTRGGIYQVKAADRAILEATMNPDKLRAFVNSKNRRATQKQTAAILSSLGALSLQANEQPTP